VTSCSAIGSPGVTRQLVEEIIMSQHPPRYDWDYSDYARLPDDGNRYEVIDGELLETPAPSTDHQHVLANLLFAFRIYLDRERVGVVLPDIDLLFVTGQFLRPDLVVVPNSSRPGITRRGVEMPPALVVEILSPTTSSIDRVKKPRRYSDFGIPEYWVVDPEERVVWVWRFAAGAIEAERVSGRLSWHPEGAGHPFEIGPEELFKPMW
jgi:Uma2 family endonuclease